MTSQDLSELKKRAAEKALEFVRDGQVVGLGTGSTARFVIEGLGRLAREGMKVTGVATSKATEKLAGESGIKIVELNDVGEIDIAIDGADEVDPAFNMIKGGGGALLREKLVALSARRRVMIVDMTKLVPTLGQGFKLPVEVVPFGWAFASRQLAALGCEPALRIKGDSPFLTDNENYILDCAFGLIPDPADMEKRIKALPGVVEVGLFINIADTLVIAFPDRVEVRERTDT